jgi:hypothetical protein
MMSRERELLKRVRDTLLELKETHYDLYWDIQTALDLREDLREGISLCDHFAGLAMQEFIALNNFKASLIVTMAYEMADKMLMERSKK